MNQFCAAVRDVQLGIWQVPVADGVDSPEELRAAARRMFDGAAAALAAGTERLTALADPPVDGRAAAVRGLTDRFGTARRQVEEGRARMEHGDPGTVLDATWPKVVAVAARPFEGVDLTAGMRAAGDGPGCAGIAGWPR
ncbi:MAG TPA: hypothetical protein VFT95_08825 [Micromonosporaceae bacterium]|nr:hypothetical protein [Micromonosporaceae bacterium]